jgi:ATP-dependent DNA helicase RecQ
MRWPCGWSVRAFVGREQRLVDEGFAAALDEIRQQAIALLRGEELPPEQADEQRDRLLGGFRWILVDEYQDIGPQQYELIGALAGRSRSDEDSRLNLFAVGDDDQNIYAFSGASVDFIRRFETDYAARAVHLIDNYRATGHLIDVANRLIAPAAKRMKAAHPIRIDRARRQQPAGGDWAKIDPSGAGRVQILPVGGDARTQALAVLGELQRLASLTQRLGLGALRGDRARMEMVAAGAQSSANCRHPGANGEGRNAQFWRQRDTQWLLDWLHDDARA